MIPTFIHTSCRGLNICLTSLAFFFYTAFQLTVPITFFGSVIPVLSFWALGTDCSILSSQFYHDTFFSVLQGKQKTSPLLFYFIFYTTVFFSLHVLHFTLSALSFSASLSLQFHVSLYFLYHILHRCSLFRNSCPLFFWVFILL